MTARLRGRPKPRGNAKIKTLPDEVQAEIYQHLKGHTYAQTSQWLLGNRGLTVAHNTLSRFWHWYPISTWVREGAEGADALDESARKNIRESKRAREARRERAQLAFENHLLTGHDLQAYLELRKFELGSQLAQAKLALESRRTALKEKAAAARERAQAPDPPANLTPQEKEARIKAVFGIE